MIAKERDQQIVEEKLRVSKKKKKNLIVNFTKMHMVKCGFFLNFFIMLGFWNYSGLGEMWNLVLLDVLVCHVRILERIERHLEHVI